ncbi:Prolyl 4-hydroxylase 1 [Pleurostoma richardsiae]|uniref:Prolyl 4-hydroxylase 1 n=1 Tax=Pleurostoma richardsiae TaxID=41990 RepID=A0AA38VJB1_9PEZI|nr:Prolyl 4-hydroxylase 1 [Pleurostoma richardsiae]
MAMSVSLTTIVGAGAGAALLALSLPYLATLSGTGALLSFVPEFPIPDFPLFYSPPAPLTTPFICEPSSYRTEIISLDPLLIYIHSFLKPADISALLEIAEPRFQPSEVVKHGRASQRTLDRTSSSAGLPRQEPAVACVLGRAREFMGAMLRDGWDEMGPPQLVRYTAGQRFNVHHDWYDTPRWATDGSSRKWNRVASFFAILQDNCTDGETHFPYLQPAVLDHRKDATGQKTAEGSKEPRRWKAADPVWRQHEDGGLAFRPITGNALFWVNLHANGTGDGRTMHSGLPVGEGLKTAMNIWPRQYYSAY